VKHLSGCQGGVVTSENEGENRSFQSPAFSIQRGALELDEGARLVDEEVDEALFSGEVATRGPCRFSQSSHLEVHFFLQIKRFGKAKPVLAEHSEAVSFIEEEEGIRWLRLF